MLIGDLTGQKDADRRLQGGGAMAFHCTIKDYGSSVCISNCDGPLRLGRRRSMREREVEIQERWKNRLGFL